MTISPQVEADSPSGMQPMGQRWEDWRIALQPIPDFVAWYRKHKISGTLLLAAFVIAKGYVLARGDLTTALAIVQYAGVVGWAAAAVMSSLPLLAAAMLAIACYQLLWPLSGDRLADLRQQLPVALVALGLCAVLAPGWFVLGAVVLGLAFGAVQWAIFGMDCWRGKSKLFADWVTWVSRLVIWAASASAVIAVLYAGWLPDEIVAFKPGKVSGEPLVYVEGPASLKIRLLPAVSVRA